jgi:DNA-binding response OmpR family regulator
LHVLVVEDDARLSRLLKRLLTQDRHVVETALTAEDGLEIATSSIELDAVILDVGLPDGPVSKWPGCFGGRARRSRS